MVDTNPILIQAGLTGKRYKSFNAWQVVLYGVDDESHPILLSLSDAAVDRIASLVERPEPEEAPA
jgi:hypothetical protein